jgi:acyl carrier protein
MDIDLFVKKFAEQFEESDVSNFAPSTNFRAIDEWSSLMALSIIAMVDDEYGVKIKGDDIKNCQTIEDLFKLVISRK